MTPPPFSVMARLGERGQVQFIAAVDDKPAAVERYAPGDGERRRKVAAKWCQNERLWEGAAPDVEAVLAELERAELDALGAVDALEAQYQPAGKVVEAAAYVDGGLIVELAWNRDDSMPDFIVYERASGNISRAPRVETARGALVVPSLDSGIVTPGGNIPGSVLLPTECGQDGHDTERLREDLHAFINRYVELTDEARELAVTYVLLTWVFDAFDELPYLCFRAADCGRGKSRAIETIGAVCYRPTFTGGGSSAAATLRLIDLFGGTLVADEFDHQRDTDSTADLTKVLNQGFQRGRPLVKCVGENNQPRPFRCYGPKLFALRRGFADDATESRTVSIRMRQRTRDDVPLNLPRARFDAEALVLRNRLLAWRLATVGAITIDPNLADPDLEDRANQIGLPLLAVAGSAERRALVVAALKDQQAAIAAERSESLSGEIFAAIVALLERDPETVRPGDVAAEVNRGRAAAEGVDVDKLKRPVTRERVGRIIARDLELPRGGRDKRGVYYTPDLVRMGQLAQRFGVALPEPTQPTLLHPEAKPTPENPPGAIKNAVGVGGVSGVGLSEGDGDGDQTGDGELGEWTG